MTMRREALSAHKDVPVGHIMTRLALLGLFAVGLAGVAAQAEAHAVGYGYPAPQVHAVGYGYPAPQVHVPEGHLPPPGECRIWFPDREPGDQPPPGSCHALKHKVPPGAYLIRG